MSVLVIGNTGYMGRHLMAGLAASGLLARGASSSDGTGIDPKTGLLPEGFAVPTGTATVVYLAQSPHSRELVRLLMCWRSIYCPQFELRLRRGRLGCDALSMYQPVPCTLLHSSR